MLHVSKNVFFFYSFLASERCGVWRGDAAGANKITSLTLVVYKHITTHCSSSQPLTCSSSVQSSVMDTVKPKRVIHPLHMFTIRFKKITLKNCPTNVKRDLFLYPSIQCAEYLSFSPSGHSSGSFSSRFLYFLLLLPIEE